MELGRIASDPPLPVPEASNTAGSVLTTGETVEGACELGISREDAVKLLRRKFGFGSVAFLAKEAMHGAGPIFYKFRGIRGVLYPIAPLEEWAIRRIGEARASFKVEAA